MAIAVDATRTESVRTDTSDPYEFAYTPTSTPRGIVVTAIHSDSSTDHIVGITYGGVTMARAVTAADTATEAGRADIWWLGASVPTGTQTVSVDLASGTTDDIQFVVFGLTGNANIEVVDTDKIEVNTANPSLTMQYGGRTCVTISAFYYGGSVAPTPNANMTNLHTHDFTAQFGSVDMQTTPGTADFVCSYTGNDDTGLAVAAFSEVVTAASLPIRSYGDPCTRVNENPLSFNSTWSLVGGGTYSALQLSTNEIIAGDLVNAEAAMVISLIDTTDQWAAITFTSIGSGTGGLVLRGTTSANTGYFYQGSNGLSQIYKQVAATFGGLASDATKTWAAKDVMVGRIVADGLTQYKNGVSNLTATDGAIPSGKPGLFIEHGAIDSFRMRGFYAMSTGHLVRPLGAVNSG